MTKQNNIREVLAKHPVIPVVTFSNLEEVDAKIEVLLRNNVKCIEITLRTPVAYDAIQKVKENYGSEITVGMGTVVMEAQIRKAIELQVDFMVSPGLHGGLAEQLMESKIAFIKNADFQSIKNSTSKQKVRMHIHKEKVTTYEDVANVLFN